jgi:hypothetical protein
VVSNIKRFSSRRQNKSHKYTIFLNAEASWSPHKNTVKKRTFSLEKYGEEEAWKRACKVRKKGIKQMDE